MLLQPLRPNSVSNRPALHNRDAKCSGRMPLAPRAVDMLPRKSLLIEAWDHEPDITGPACDGFNPRNPLFGMEGLSGRCPWRVGSRT
jgi:hypothetical protein